MKPHEELRLYQNDYAAWCKYVAPRWRAMVDAADKEGKRALWEKASPLLRDEVTKLKK